MSLKRRDFLKLAGGASIGLPLMGCIAGRSPSEIPWVPGIESWVPTVCLACQGGCGLLVRKIDDRSVKVEGNPLHPLNRGRVCPRGQAGLQLLYNPDRITQPLQRVGERFSGKWEPVGWEEALSLVASRLNRLRDEGSPQALAFVSRHDQSTSHELLSRFLEVYGSPHFITVDEWAPLKQVHYLSRGVYEVPALDLEKTRYVLSFGSDFLTNWPTLMENQRVYGDKRASKDIKIVQIEPRFSLCASRADRWIPALPGTEGLLALGMASVIIKNGTYDRSYIQRFTRNFEDFREAVLGGISIEQVSEATGVPLRAIIETAKEFSSLQPAVALADPNLSVNADSLFPYQAVHSLNALVGNIDVPGGLLSQRTSPLKKMPAVDLDEKARKGLASPAEDLSDLRCLFLWGNGLSLPPQVKDILMHAGSETPYVVSFAPFLDEMSGFADLILPDVTYFEKWQERPAPPQSKISTVGIGRPVVSPLFRSRPHEDVMLDLAKRMGEPLARNFPWNSFKDLVLYRLQGLYEARRGIAFSNLYEESHLRILEERGWWIPWEKSPDGFIEDLMKKGGWEDPVYHYQEAGYIYQNEERKHVFFTPRNIALKRESSFLREPDQEFGLILHFYDLPFNSGGVGSEQPWYQENLGFRFNLRWKRWVEINPETAEEEYIRDGDVVYVETSQGKMEAIAKTFPGIMPGVLGIPLGKAENFPVHRESGSITDPLSLIGGKGKGEEGKRSGRPVRGNIYRKDRSRA